MSFDLDSQRTQVQAKTLKVQGMSQQISPFSSGPRNDISIEMILSLMQDPDQDEIRHNVEVLIYLMTH